MTWGWGDRSSEVDEDDFAAAFDIPWDDEGFRQYFRMNRQDQVMPRFPDACRPSTFHADFGGYAAR